MLLANRGDRLLGRDEFSDRLPLFRDFGVLLGENAGRAERHKAFDGGAQKLRKRVREQNGVGGAVERLEGRKVERLRLAQIGAKPNDVGFDVRLDSRLVAWRSRYRKHAAAMAAQVLDNVAADQPAASDDQASGWFALSPGVLLLHVLRVNSFAAASRRIVAE